MQRLIAVSLLLSLGAVQAHASPCAIEGLGDADGLNVVTLGDFTGKYSAINGFAAVGGDATFTGYGVAQDHYSSTGSATLQVGGDLTTTDVQINGGDALIAGTCSMTRTNVHHGSASCAHGGSMLDASTLAPDMQDISAHLAGKAATHAVTTYSWGTVTLDATGASGEAVFDLDLDAVAADLSPWVSSINNFEIKAPSGTTVVVNVSGDTSIFLQGGGFNLTGVSADTVILNFPTQTSLSIKNSGIEASVLAPYAAVSMDWGHLNGTLVALSFDGTGAFRDTPFDGDICVPPVCAEVLLHCDSRSAVLDTVCDTDGTVTLSSYASRNASYIRFGPGVSSVTLEHVFGGDITLTGDTNLCSIGGGWNDRVLTVTVD
jgi:choice-of-anchor A domain-containing protein